MDVAVVVVIATVELISILQPLALLLRRYIVVSFPIAPRQQQLRLWWQLNQLLMTMNLVAVVYWRDDVVLVVVTA
jgi:hypothetical protein